MRRRNVRTLSLIVVTFTYLLIGAAVFDALEGPNNELVYQGLAHIKQQFVQKYNVSQDDYKVMELLIIEKKPHKAGPQWKFSGSFYYAMVVLTLIGYGHSTPATVFGKAFTMAYATAGIPMAMIMFQSMGERMNKFYSVIIRKVREWNSCARTEATQFDLIIASGITSSIVIWSGAIMYHTQEGWPFFDSLYYTLITLSTIGFGDFVALQNSKALQFNPGYVACSFIFLLLGLAALSSSINLLVLRFMILSLEDEDDKGGDLQNAAQNIITFDGDVMANAVVNGRLLGGSGLEATSERDLCPERGLAVGGSAGGTGHFRRGRAADSASVCSCTCYGRGGGGGGEGSTRGRRRWRVRRALASIGRLCGCKELGSSGLEDEENYYDEETQSISNYARFAIKRASF